MQNPPQVPNGIEEPPLRIAAIVPLFNGELFIRQALESILLQTVRVDEIIVVDDGSTDNGASLVEELMRENPVAPIRLLRKENGGQSSARNLGINSTTCELIALLDQDDSWYANHIQVLMEPFARNCAGEIGLVYGDLDHVDAAGRLVTRNFLSISPSTHPKTSRKQCLSEDMYILPGASLFRKSAFEAAGGFDERLSGYEDASALASKPVRRHSQHSPRVCFERHRPGVAEVTVVISLYNYADHILEALDSVEAQTLEVIDLIVVDDCSTDQSLSRAQNWFGRHHERFNRILLLANEQNCGLGIVRNIGIEAAHSPFVMILDADNRLHPRCCERLLARIRDTAFAFAYATIQQFDGASGTLSAVPYHPQGFVAGNYIDAMALVAKEAWAIVGGYEPRLYGWEDYDFWCRLAEHGLEGCWVNETLADYRVHRGSMLTTLTNRREVQHKRLSAFEGRHPWVRLLERADAPSASGLLSEKTESVSID